MTTGAVSKARVSEAQRIPPVPKVERPVSASVASAQEVKVGVILPYTGVGAELAQQIERGAQLYLKLNPDQAKPYTFNMIKRDSKAPNGAEAKIAAQELLTQDKVDVLAGWVSNSWAAILASAPFGALESRLIMLNV